MTAISDGVRRSILAMRPDGRRQSHCSSLLITPSGAALVAFFAGTREGASDCRIMISRIDRAASEGARPPAITVQLPSRLNGPHWNPVLTLGLDDRIWLFFKVGDTIPGWQTWVCHSGDDGWTWSSARPLVPNPTGQLRDESGGRGPVRHPPVRLGEAWVAPGSIEQWTDPPRWDCFVDVSADAGRSWNQSWLPLEHDGMRGAGCIQPALWRNPEGGLTALCRSTAGAAYRSTSVDGREWSPLTPVELPNNNSGLAAVPLPDGRILSVHNPSTDNWGPRCPLVASISADDGLTWRQALIIEDGSGLPGAPDDAGRLEDGKPTDAAASGVITEGDGEYSYPSAALVGTEVWVTYTWQRRGIALARVVRI